MRKVALAASVMLVLASCGERATADVQYRAGLHPFVTVGREIDHYFTGQAVRPTDSPDFEQLWRRCSHDFTRRTQPRHRRHRELLQQRQRIV